MNSSFSVDPLNLILDELSPVSKKGSGGVSNLIIETKLIFENKKI